MHVKDYSIYLVGGNQPIVVVCLRQGPHTFVLKINPVVGICKPDHISSGIGQRRDIQE